VGYCVSSEQQGAVGIAIAAVAQGSDVAKELCIAGMVVFLQFISCCFPSGSNGCRM